ncbi:hypothetical protein [Micromonospora sp. B9E7]|uniref:hypothetical protein n=1 Tax=Micromonospora sp. B9E7 TaxID=3153574 RepID=UPI00325D3C7C
MKLVPLIPNDMEGQLEFLCEVLGKAFIDWVLVNPSGPLTPNQAEALDLLITLLRQGQSSVGHPGSARLILSGLTQYYPEVNTSALNYLRIRSTTQPLPRFTKSEDDLLDALTEAAVEIYGELLLNLRNPHAGILGPYASPVMQRLRAAVTSDPSLPFRLGDENAGVYIVTTAGQATSIQGTFAGTSIISAAWEQVRMHNPATPSLENLVEALPTALDKARTALSGSTVKTTGLCSFTGATLPSNAVIELGWGRLRSARFEDHPEFVDSMVERRTVGQAESGEEVVISDAGDVILEVDVPFRIDMPAAPIDFTADFTWPKQSSTLELEKRVLQVRIALMLALERATIPVVLPVWRRFVQPIGQGGSVGISDPELSAPRVPSTLSSMEVESWREWIGRLDSVELLRLGVAPARLLRAVAERRDPFDSLIDSVICWEAIFGGDAEMTLRVSSAIARLLRPPGPERQQLRREVADLYRLRSKVVHGVGVAMDDVIEASKTAIRLGIQIVRTLATDRVDLINKTSSERSILVLMD